jgi:hypothetical protein
MRQEFMLVIQRRYICNGEARAMAIWLQVKRIFVPKRFRVNGVIKERRIRVLVPMLFVWAETEVIGPRDYRIVPWRRGSQTSYSLSALATPLKEKWPMPRLRPDPLPQWKGVESLDERGVMD